MNLHLRLESHQMKILSWNLTQTCIETETTSLYPWHFKKITRSHVKSIHSFEHTFAPKISPHKDIESKFDSDVYWDRNNKFIPMAFRKNNWDMRKVKTSHLYLIKAQNIHLNLHLGLESHHMKILSWNLTQTCIET